MYKRERLRGKYKDEILGEKHKSERLRKYKEERLKRVKKGRD